MRKGRAGMLHEFRKYALLCVIAFATAAMAQDPALLARAGYPLDTCTVLMHWNEQAPARPEATVQGVRVQPNDGSAAAQSSIGTPEPLTLDVMRTQAIWVAARIGRPKTFL